MGFGDKIKNLLKFFEGLQEGFRSKSVEYIQIERRELENVFSILLFGSYIGMPAPPTFLSLELLPYVARELYVLGTTAERLDDPLGQIAEFFEM